MPKKKEAKDLLTLERRRRFEKALKEREKMSEPLIEKIRESERITDEDLRIRINAK